MQHGANHDALSPQTLPTSRLTPLIGTVDRPSLTVMTCRSVVQVGGGILVDAVATGIPTPMPTSTPPRGYSAIPDRHANGTSHEIHEAMLLGPPPRPGPSHRTEATAPAHLAGHMLSGGDGLALVDYGSASPVNLLQNPVAAITQQCACREGGHGRSRRQARRARPGSPVLRSWVGGTKLVFLTAAASSRSPISRINAKCRIVQRERAGSSV